MKLSEIVETIVAKQKEIPNRRSLLVGISGIDGSGKGFVTGKLVEAIRARGVNAVGINIDGWLNLPQIRLTKTNKAENFYQNALRFEEMFGQLILPLKENRSIRLIADFLEETDKEFRQHEYFYEDIEVILLEGIFLFKREFQAYFDLKIWIECSFETALKRAVKRSQEGLPPAETVAAYETIYFPAERIHFDRDDPHTTADLFFDNDKFWYSPADI